MKIWLYFLQHIMLFFIRNSYLTTEKINYNIMNIFKSILNTKNYYMTYILTYSG